MKKIRYLLVIIAFGLGAQYSHFLNGAQQQAGPEAGEEISEDTLKQLLVQKITCLVSNMVDDLNYGSSTWSKVYGSLPAAPLALYGAYDVARKTILAPTDSLQSLKPMKGTYVYNALIAAAQKTAQAAQSANKTAQSLKLVAPPKTDYLGKSLGAAAVGLSAYALWNVSKSTNSAIKNDILACIQKANASKTLIAQYEAIETFIAFIKELNKFDINAAKQIIKGQGQFHPIIGNVDKEIKTELKILSRELIDSHYDRLKNLQKSAHETMYYLRLCEANKIILQFFKTLSSKTPADSKNLRIKIFEIVKNYNESYQPFLTNLLMDTVKPDLLIAELIPLEVASKDWTFFAEYNFHDFQEQSIQKKLLKIRSPKKGSQMKTIEPFAFLDQKTKITRVYEEEPGPQEQSAATQQTAPAQSKSTESKRPAAAAAQQPGQRQEGGRQPASDSPRQQAGQSRIPNKTDIENAFWDIDGDWDNLTQNYGSLKTALTKLNTLLNNIARNKNQIDQQSLVAIQEAIQRLFKPFLIKLVTHMQQLDQSKKREIQTIINQISESSRIIRGG